MAGQSRDRNIANSPPNGAFENTKLDLQLDCYERSISLWSKGWIRIFCGLTFDLFPRDRSERGIFLERERPV